MKKSKICLKLYGPETGMCSKFISNFSSSIRKYILVQNSSPTETTFLKVKLQTSLMMFSKLSLQSWIFPISKRPNNSFQSSKLQSKFLIELRRLRFWDGKLKNVMSKSEAYKRPKLMIWLKRITNFQSSTENWRFIEYKNSVSSWWESTLLSVPPRISNLWKGSWKFSKNSVLTT